MIHARASSNSSQRNKRRTNSGRNLLEPIRTIRLNEPTTSKVTKDVQESTSKEFLEIFDQEKSQADLAKMLEEKKIYPIAPDCFIPNSAYRSLFKIKEIEPVEVKMFQIRMILPSTSDTLQIDFDERLIRYSVLTNFDIIHSTIFQLLNRIDLLEKQNQNNKNHNWQNDDDEWVELDDPDASFRRTPSKSNLRTKPDITGNRQKDGGPDIFKRLRSEPWWQSPIDDSNNNLRSMVLCLIDILRDKEVESFESACNYIAEIFRTYGIEPELVNQILGILLDHLVLSDNDPLNVHTVRTIAQFMIERKNIIMELLSFALKYQSDNILRQETINAIKFLTDVNSSDDIELVLNNIPDVRAADEDTFSLKSIIHDIKAKLKPLSGLKTGDDDNENVVLHPLLKKISEERWYPRDNNSVTLDSVIDAIITKLPNASKSMLKTLTTHLVQLSRVIGYSNEQHNKVANGLIGLLSHNDADYRLIAATILADLGKETKTIAIALLNSFVNDPRILVRTECGDSLKKLTGIMSDTVLKDCADEIQHLQSLPERNFSIRNYLNEKNRVPTPDEQPQNEEEEAPIEPTDTEKQDDVFDLLPINNQIEDSSTVVRVESPSLVQEPSFTEINNPLVQASTSQFSVVQSVISGTTGVTHVEPPIRVEINKPFEYISEKESAHGIPPPPPPSGRIGRQRKHPTDLYNRGAVKPIVSDQSPEKRSTLLPNSSNMWDLYAKQNEITEETQPENAPKRETSQEQIFDPIQKLIEDHKRRIGYYRFGPNRPVLTPHKITFSDVFADLSHLTVDKNVSFRSSTNVSSTMHLSDLNNNKRHLEEVEFVQLLSSLLIRSVQVHRKHDRFIPGPYAANIDSSKTFTNALSISQIQLHSPTSLDHTNFYVPTKLPPIVREGRSSAELDRIQNDVEAKAKRTGVNLRKARDIEDALSHLIQSDQEHRRATFAPANTPYSSTLEHTDVTHGWLLEQLLRSQGTIDAQHHVYQIGRTYPKFIPLLNSRIPQHLISRIWNDPVMKQLSSIISHKQDDSMVDDNSTKRSFTKTSIPTFDDEHSSNFFDYSASTHLLTMQQQQRDEQKKKYLPPIHGVKMRLPRHVLKFGFRELEVESPDLTITSLRDENTSKSRRRKIYMHLMMSVNIDVFVRHELVKSQLRNMLKTESQSSSTLPFISKPPSCN